MAAMLPAGCASASPLRIAAHVWPGYELMFLARSLGWLPEDLVRLIETRSASDSLAALARGEAEGAALTLDEVLRARASGIPLSVVLVFDISAGADVVLARPHVATLRKLAGRRIGVETSALGALMLYKLLEAAGLTLQDVTVVPLAIDNHLSAWDQEQLDALVTYEPVASKLEARGLLRLFDSRALPNTIFDVLAVRGDALKTHAAAVRMLVAAHFRGLRHLQTNPQDASYRMAARLNLPANAVYQSFSGMQLPSLDINRHLLAPAGELRAAAAQLVPLMRESGMLPRADDLAHLMSDDFLPRGGA